MRITSALHNDCVATTVAGTPAREATVTATASSLAACLWPLVSFRVESRRRIVCFIVPCPSSRLLIFAPPPPVLPADSVGKPFLCSLLPLLPSPRRADRSFPPSLTPLHHEEASSSSEGSRCAGA